MTDQNILEKYPNVPPIVAEAISTPYFGCNGGNPNSPIWFCALENGGKSSTLKPREYFIKDDGKNLGLDIDEMLRRLDGQFNNKPEDRLPAGSATYRSLISILTAIIDGDNKLYDRDPAGWVKEYKICGSSGYGLFLNAFPLSMPRRGKVAENRWEQKELVVDPLAPEKTSFKEWFDIPSFKEFRNWCVPHRRRPLCEIRNQYHPSLIYCGGLDDKDNFFNIWTDGTEKEVGSGIFKFGPYKKRCEYCWLHYGTGFRTLLAVGPFLGWGGVSSYEDWGALGESLRNLCNEGFGSDSWLRKEDFPPYKTVRNS